MVIFNPKHIFLPDQTALNSVDFVFKGYNDSDKDIIIKVNSTCSCTSLEENVTAKARSNVEIPIIFKAPKTKGEKTRTIRVEPEGEPIVTLTFTVNYL